MSLDLLIGLGWLLALVAIALFVLARWRLRRPGKRFFDSAVRPGPDELFRPEGVRVWNAAQVITVVGVALVLLGAFAS